MRYRFLLLLAIVLVMSLGTTVAGVQGAGPSTPEKSGLVIAVRDQEVPLQEGTVLRDVQSDGGGVLIMVDGQGLGSFDMTVNTCNGGKDLIVEDFTWTPGEGRPPKPMGDSVTSRQETVSVGVANNVSIEAPDLVNPMYIPPEEPPPSPVLLYGWS